MFNYYGDYFEYEVLVFIVSKYKINNKFKYGYNCVYVSGKILCLKYIFLSSVVLL